MRIKIYRIEEPTEKLETFADRYDLEMEVREFPRDRKGYRFCAYLMGVYIRDGALLHAPTGTGNTPEAAIADYASLISTQALGFTSRGKACQVDAPKLTYEKP